MNKLTFDTVRDILEYAGFTLTISNETENEYGTINYKILSDSYVLDSLLIFDHGIMVDTRIEVHNASN